MAQALPATQPAELQPAATRLAARIRLGLGLVTAVAAETYFLRYFDAGRFQPTVDLSWLVASAAWVIAFWRSDPPVVPALRHPFWLYALYAAMLLPFATNWRWALTGDNLSWPLLGIETAKHGLNHSILSVNGADDFGHLQMLLHDGFMFLVAPTLFWHRVGKILVGVTAFAAVYTVFARLVTPLFGILVAACSVSTSVWIVYTYASVPFIDGIASGYALLAIGMWVRRSPDSRKAWLMLGLLSGFMLFLTPNGWFMALCVWGWLTPQVPWRRWSPAYFALAVATGLLVGLPNLIQWAHGQGNQLFSMVENPAWTISKIRQFMYEAATIPFQSEVNNSGAFGPQLPPGFRWLFVPGILIMPLVPRRWAPGARLILGIYVVHVIILTFAQGPYASVSVKRSLVLIPMATYFLYLPFRRVLRYWPVVALLIATWASFGVYDVVAHMQPGRTGYNYFDGIIEADQRFSDAPRVCVIITKDVRANALNPGSEVDRLYHIAPHLQHVTSPADPACRDVLCYCPQTDTIDLQALGYTPVPMLNTVELRCGRRKAAPAG